LPHTTFFSGKNKANSWLEDGNYTFSIIIETHDNVIYKTIPQNIYAVTNLIKNVYITSPKHADIVTDGVILVQGQAPYDQSLEGKIPFFKGQVTVKICIDTIAANVSTLDCGFFEQTGADQNGYFSSLVLLPRLEAMTQSIHDIYAIAYDGFGNQTQPSNVVRIFQDTILPFNHVAVSPALTAATPIAQYESFLKRELSVNEVQSVIISANVTDNTEAVEISFAQSTNIKNMPPDNNKFQYIALINSTIEHDLMLNPNKDADIKLNHDVSLASEEFPNNKCSNNGNGCNWKVILPIPSDFGGIYEVKFKALKGGNIEDTYAGFKVDNTISASPVVTSVEKFEPSDDNWHITTYYDGIYHTNRDVVRLRGYSEPEANLVFTLQDNTVFKATSTHTGIWEKRLHIPTNMDSSSELSNCVHNDQNICLEFLFTVSIGVEEASNTTVFSEIRLKYDHISPDVESVSKTLPMENMDNFVKTGDKVIYHITTSEAVNYASIIKEDSYLRMLTNFYQNTLWIGSINVDREHEGIYSPTIDITDIAGNSSTISTDKMNLIIDNTLPHSQPISTQHWNTPGGILIKDELPVNGRLSPEYVTRSDNIELTGLAEANQRIKVFVNNIINFIVPISNTNCEILQPNKVTPDGSIVEYGNVCSFSYSFDIPNNGKNQLQGIPTEYYIFQIQVLDRAGNRSDFSKQEIVYHDTYSPHKPELQTY